MSALAPPTRSGTPIGIQGLVGTLCGRPRLGASMDSRRIAATSLEPLTEDPLTVASAVVPPIIIGAFVDVRSYVAHLVRQTPPWRIDELAPLWLRLLWNFPQPHRRLCRLRVVAHLSTSRVMLGAADLALAHR